MDKHHFVTIANLSKEKIMYLIEMAQEFEKHPNRELLKGRGWVHESSAFLTPRLRVCRRVRR